MSLSSKFSNGVTKPDFKFSNKLLHFGVISLVIIVVGMIFLLGFGFNYSFDFAGGYSMTIKAGVMLDDSEKYECSVDKVRQAFSENSQSVHEIYKVSDGDDAAIIVNYKKSADLSSGELAELNQTISQKIETELKGENADFAITVEEVDASSAKDIVINTLWVFAIAAVASCIYVFIRHKFMFALNLLIAIIHDIMMLVAIAAITRLQVGEGFFALLGLSMVLTTVMYVVNAARIKANRVKQAYKENSNEEVVDISLKQTFVTNLFVALLTIVCVFTLSAMGAVEFIAAIYALLAVLIVLYSQHFVICPLWAKLIKKDGFSVYSKAIKQSSENKEQEEVEIITE